MKDGAADLKSPELVLVILVLALHVAIPDHQQCQHLDRDLDEDLSPASVVNTLPPSIKCSLQIEPVVCSVQYIVTTMTIMIIGIFLK